MHQSNRRLIESSQGYTLIEALFSITVFVLLSQIMLAVLIWIEQMNTTELSNNQVAWELFVNDIQQLVLNVREIKLSNDTKSMEIFYTNSSEVKKINRSGDVLRLIVNNQGNTPLLVGIQNAWFTWDGQYMTILVIFNNGIEKERRFFVQNST
ncbi:ComGF family competence protein [Ureibacillus chungkukjangi]|uniref:competence type IV pilus minor pilin ComGF n=1 Tax=Ureibacillus chungkukjangi TaxID=1202712 RepID=UPI0020406EB3|nr:competence type IV pilus minor pilin ComGF [Ureibacillus chungkukjangi]MCM3389930.1 ComGF family competence protein [Ureibacillus chungkukjangi]